MCTANQTRPPSYSILSKFYGWCEVYAIHFLWNLIVHYSNFLFTKRIQEFYCILSCSSSLFLRPSKTKLLSKISPFSQSPFPYPRVDFCGHEIKEIWHCQRRPILFSAFIVPHRAVTSLQPDDLSEGISRHWKPPPILKRFSIWMEKVPNRPEWDMSLLSSLKMQSFRRNLLATY